MDNKNLHIKIVIFTFLFILFIGTFSFHYLEKWSYIDSFYFSVATMTTVGYGDLVPTSDFSKIFLSIYSLISITLYISIAVVFGEWYVEKIMANREKIKEIKENFRSLKK